MLQFAETLPLQWQSHHRYINLYLSKLGARGFTS